MLSKILAKNFLSWKDLQFPISKGVTLVDGWNEDDGRSEGSGKSSVLNAMSWGIYGKLPKDVNVDDVIKDGETSCEVILEFENGDSIVRTRKPNDLYLIKSGIVTKGKDSRETQSLIEEYVGYNFETFCQSVYFAQNYDKKFLISNQSEKGKILSSIQNLQIFDKAGKETSTLIKLENEKISGLRNQIQISKNNIENLESQKSLIQSFIQDKIQKHQQQLSSLNHQKELVFNNINKTLEDIEFTNQKISEINVEDLSKVEKELNQNKSNLTSQLGIVSHQKSEVHSIRLSIINKENEGKTLADRYKSIEQKLKSLNPTGTPRYRSLANQRDQVLNLDQNISRSRLLSKVKQLKDFIENPTKNCPSCGSELNSVDTSHTQKELELVLQEVHQIEVSSQVQAKDIERQMNEEVILVGDQAHQLSLDLQNILNQLIEVGRYLEDHKIPSEDELNTQEKYFKESISQIDQYLLDVQKKKNEHSKLLTQLQVLTNQNTSYSNQYSQIELSISQLGQPDVKQDQDKLEILDKNLWDYTTKFQELTNLLEESEKHLSRLEILKDGFKEIKSYIFTNALNELNFRANQYLSELFDTQASIKFSNMEQDIETRIILNGHQRSIGLLSGGQNRRFNFAVDLALSDITSYRKGSKLNLLVYDEYFKDLSETSMEKCLNLLKSRKRPVILIEHNSLFKNIINNTFFVRLKDKTSFESKVS